MHIKFRSLSALAGLCLFTINIRVYADEITPSVSRWLGIQSTSILEEENWQEGAVPSNSLDGHIILLGVEGFSGSSLLNVPEEYAVNGIEHISSSFFRFNGSKLRLGSGGIQKEEGAGFLLFSNAVEQVGDATYEGNVVFDNSYEGSGTVSLDNVIVRDASGFTGRLNVSDSLSLRSLTGPGAVIGLNGTLTMDGVDTDDSWLSGTLAEGSSGKVIISGNSSISGVDLTQPHWEQLTLELDDGVIAGNYTPAATGYQFSGTGRVDSMLSGLNDLRVTELSSIHLTHASNDFEGSLYIAGRANLTAGSLQALGNASNAIVFEAYSGSNEPGVLDDQGSLTVNFSPEQVLLDRIDTSATDGPRDLLLGADATHDLDFSAQPDLRLGVAGGTEATYSGVLTPHEDTFRLHLKFAGSLTLDTENSLADGPGPEGARSLVVTGSSASDFDSSHIGDLTTGILNANADQSYSGGTLITDGVIVHARTTGALGSGTIEVEHGSLVVSNPTDSTFSSLIHVDLSNVEKSSSVVLNSAGNISSDIVLTGPEVADTEDQQITPLQLLDGGLLGFRHENGHYSGTISSQGNVTIALGFSVNDINPVFAGSLDLHEGALLLLSEKLDVQVSLGITAGVNLAVVSLGANAVSLSHDIVFGSESLFLALYEFGINSFSMEGDASIIIEDGALLNLIHYKVRFENTPDSPGLYEPILLASVESGEIEGMFTPVNLPEGYDVSIYFEEDGTEMWMQFAAIPEPETMAMMLALVALGFVTFRRLRLCR